MFPLQVVTVGAAGATSVTFSNIPATYTHLQIRGIARTNRTASPAQDALQITFNSDTGNNYAHHYLLGDGSSASAGANTTRANILLDGIANNSATSGVFGAFNIDLLDYANTNKYKTLRHLSGWDNNGSGAIWLESGLWQSTSAVTSIRFVPNGGTNFLQYSQFALYGIRSA
jgi:hypothetical protein